MDQPAHAEKDRLIDDPDPAEIIQPFSAFLRPDTVTGIDCVCRHLLHASWAGPTAFRYVTPRGPTHDDGSILGQPGSPRRRRASCPSPNRSIDAE
jgi:hypothetical protein